VRGGKKLPGKSIPKMAYLCREWDVKHQLHQSFDRINSGLGPQATETFPVASVFLLPYFVNLMDFGVVVPNVRTENKIRYNVRFFS